MYNFSKVFFGLSDAEREAERHQKEFEEAFFDPHNFLKELTEGYRFLLVGRKGGGKTAFAERIRLCAEQGDYYAWKKSLNNFDDSTFSLIKTNDNFSANPFLSFWKCILLIEFVNMLNERTPNILDENYQQLVATLTDYGFINPDNDLSVTVKKLVEVNSEISLHSIYKRGKKGEYTNELRGSDQIANAIKNRIKSLYVKEKGKFMFIIDGVDDIMNHAEFNPKILTGLIKAADELNSDFLRTTLKVKIVLLIRDDIFKLCRDTNMNKIKRDSGLELMWSINSKNKFESDLLKLVGKRVDREAGEANSLEHDWSTIFPDKIAAKNSLDYLLANIIYRPRDILQLFTELQRVYAKRQLSELQIETALKKFSTAYFIDTMRDELTGFFPDEVVTRLPAVLSTIGSRTFSVEDFNNICLKYPEFSDVACNDILQRLFEDGYVGQLRPRKGRDEFIVFSYINLEERFNPDHQCIVHMGLTRALTMK